MSVWLRCRCEFSFQLETSTPFLFMLRPCSGSNQWITHQKFELNPSVPANEFTDLYGNLCQSLVAPPGPFELITSTLAQTASAVDENPEAGFVEIREIPASALCYLLPSRYCESDRLGELATTITGGVPAGYPQVLAIINWMRETIAYRPGSSNVPVSALEVERRRFGVCRDFAHLGMALCRSLSIPSRMVVGYLQGLEPMDMHAWFEVYVGGRWYTMDATQSSLAGARLAVAYGRDAADVAVFNQFGDPAIPTREFVSVEAFAESPGSV